MKPTVKDIPGQEALAEYLLAAYAAGGAMDIHKVYDLTSPSQTEIIKSSLLKIRQ